jgi:hypothetical protein
LWRHNSRGPKKVFEKIWILGLWNGLSCIVVALAWKKRTGHNKMLFNSVNPMRSIHRNTHYWKVRHLGYKASFSWLRRWALTNVTHTKTRLYIQSDVLSGRVYWTNLIPTPLGGATVPHTVYNTLTLKKCSGNI